MGLVKEKKVETSSVPAISPLAENGTAAAVGRLTTPKNTGADKPSTDTGKVPYKGRDFDKEARGKTRCVQFVAALQSPALAGLKFNTLEEFLELVRKAADAGVKYSFED